MSEAAHAAEHHPALHHLRLRRNLGKSHALTVGMDRASGEAPPPLPPEVVEACDARVTVPSRAASLNAAASVRSVVVRAAMAAEVRVAEAPAAMAARAGVVHVAVPVAGVGGDRQHRDIELQGDVLEAGDDGPRQGGHAEKVAVSTVSERIFSVSVNSDTQ